MKLTPRQTFNVKGRVCGSSNESFLEQHLEVESTSNITIITY